MTACRNYLEFQNYAAFASLLRHPDMFEWLCERSQNNRWLGDLDNYQNNHLPNRITINSDQPFGDPEKIKLDFDPTVSKSEARAQRRADSMGLLNQLHADVGELLKPLLGDPQPIANWNQPWSEILNQVYGERTLDKTDPADRQTIKACREIYFCLLYTSPSPRDATLSRMPSSA